MRNDTRGFQTDAIHAGEAEHSSSTPISLGATSDAVYYRTGNPTLAAFDLRTADTPTAAQHLLRFEASRVTGAGAACP